MERKTPSGWFTVLAVLLVCKSAFGQFREETAALENMYESRARAVLNTVLRPQEYSLVVSAEIERDDAKFKKIEDEVERNALPGMPGAGNFDTMSLSNDIHELKNRIDVHVVLTTTVQKEKEDTIRALLKMKLHLDEGAGDSIVLTRANLPTEVLDKPVSTLPELSWKMWGMIVVLSLLAMAALMMYLAKRQAKSEAEEAAAPEKEVAATPVAEEATEKTDISSLDSFELLYEQKKQLMSFINQYPEASIRALSEHFQKGNEADIVLMCEAYGWELSKKMFAGFSPKLWGKIGHRVLTREKLPTLTETQKALEVCYKIVLSRYLEMGDTDQSNPFGFIWKLSANDRTRLLDNESPFNLALICVNSDREQMSEILESLSDQVQEAITIQIARLQTVPEESVKASSEMLLKKFKQIQEKPELRMEGAILAAELLRALPAEKESQIFAKLQMENPAEADGIRREVLMYADIMHVPQDIIGEIGSALEISTFVDALRGSIPEVRAYILKALPPKRAMMIERDLQLEAPHFSMKVGARAQREIVTHVSTTLKAKGIELGQLLPHPGVIHANFGPSSKVEAA